MSNEHDITKKMLDTIRESKLASKGLLTENTSNDGAAQLDGGTIKDEQKKFMEIVGPRVQFKAFNVYPNDGNVILAGEFDNGLGWQFSKRDGLYITADNIKLDSEVTETIKKLNAYYNNWVDEWSQKLNTEYKAQQ